MTKICTGGMAPRELSLSLPLSTALSLSPPVSPPLDSYKDDEDEVEDDEEERIFCVFFDKDLRRGGWPP